MTKRILVIDDEIAIQHMVTRILTSNGYSVSNTSDGKNGLEMLAATSFDLIILDICMPLVSGN